MLQTINILLLRLLLDKLCIDCAGIGRGGRGGRGWGRRVGRHAERHEGCCLHRVDSESLGLLSDSGSGGALLASQCVKHPLDPAANPMTPLRGFVGCGRILAVLIMETKVLYRVIQVLGLAILVIGGLLCKAVGGGSGSDGRVWFAIFSSLSTLDGGSGLDGFVTWTRQFV